MLGGLRMPPHLTQFTSGGSHSSSSASNTFDYSGLERHLEAQDEVDKLRSAKFGALYNGDVAGSVAAGGRIRNLLGVLNANVPGSTERQPFTVVDPLKKLSNASSSRSNDLRGPSFAGSHENQDEDANGRKVLAPKPRPVDLPPAGGFGA